MASILVQDTAFLVRKVVSYRGQHIAFLARSGVQKCNLEFVFDPTFRSLIDRFSENW